MKPLTATLSPESPAYLKDHAFQDMVVLPGTFYVALALQAAGPSARLQGITFKSPLVFTGAENISLKVEGTQRAQNQWHFQCTSDENLVHAETLVVSSPLALEPTRYDQPEEIRQRCDNKIAGEDFYAQLKTNGNQYGPAFRGVEALWLGQREALGRIEVPTACPSATNTFPIHPVLLDTCIQVMSAAHPTPGRTFVLAGIDQLQLNEGATNCRWCHAWVEKGDKTDILKGHLRGFDQDGRQVLAMEGISFRYADWTMADNKAKIAIASTFTAEPIEEVIQFWSEQLERPLAVEFAPYNQVFQQLLDPSSLLRSNKNGLNALLVRFEDWLSAPPKLPTTKVDIAKKDQLLATHQRHTLPNGLEIAHLNRYETEYLYQEIFVDETYLKHGITFDDEACIIDIGANIGFFTLYSLQQCKSPRIYAFEPAPPVYELLKANAALYGSQVQVFNCGVSDQAGEADFTFYGKSSVFSSFDPDRSADEKAIRTVVENTLHHHQIDPENHDITDQFMEGRLESQTYRCQLKSLSQIIAENQIETIDLLKIDAEKSELRVLQGISGEDWAKIRQIVIEVHDREGPLIAKIKTLLEQRGFTLALEEEQLLEESGLYTLFAKRPSAPSASKPAQDQDTQLAEMVDYFVAGVQQAAGCGAPFWIGICPPAPDQSNGARWASHSARLEAALAPLSNVYLATTAQLQSNYPVEDYYESTGEKMGRIPYTPPFFASLGTQLMRTYTALERQPYKVVVLDCDQTLWKGICGEEGTAGIEIATPYKKLQEFMVRLHNAGMLLALCSKNNEEDVLEVFSRRDDMVLKLDHIVDHKINWLPKSANIKALAADLGLGLDSFIFVDDNPVECAEVKANCPQVLTLQLPEAPDQIPQFLESMWAFDHLKTTEEDKKRTQLYQQNINREHFRQQSTSLGDFLAGLQLEVEIAPVQPHQLERVAQLTYRTNQFNCTTKRRTTAELQDLCSDGKLECLVVQVRDRFGDYGLVGVLLYTAVPKGLEVDTLLLSCRVLGRGVEHRMLAMLGNLAIERDLEHVEIPYFTTSKNQPIFQFLQQTVGRWEKPLEKGAHFTCPATYLCDLDYAPEVEEPPKAVAATSDFTQPSQPSSAPLEQIAQNFGSAAKIRAAVEARRLRHRPQNNAAYVAPANELEKNIASVWQQVLGFQAGRRDSFFEVGGTSLLGVQLIAGLKRQLGYNISIVDLFQYPTISALATDLSNKQSGRNETESSLGSSIRGAKRRERIRSKRRR